MGRRKSNPDDNYYKSEKYIEHKRKCLDCKYSGYIGFHAANRSNGEGLLNVCCDYLLLTGKQRPCRAINCKLYKEGK